MRWFLDFSFFALFSFGFVVGVGFAGNPLVKSRQSNSLEGLNFPLKVNLDDSHVRRKIISGAKEVLIEKNEDGSYIFYEPLARLPYKGTGWVVIFHSDGKQPLALKQLKMEFNTEFRLFGMTMGRKNLRVITKRGKRMGN